MKVSHSSVRALATAFAAVLLVPISTFANVAPSSSSSADEPPDPAFHVSMTAYNAVPEQTSSHPNVTASGAYSDPDVIAARSQDLASELPFGTVIEIQATSSPTCGYAAESGKIGLRVIADSMNAKMHDKIDVLLPLNQTTASGKTQNPAIVLGLCKNVTIKVVGHVDVSDIPRTQAELAAVMASSDEVADAK